MTELDLDAIEARVNAASEGPSSMAFIVFNDVPAMAAEIRRLRSELQAAKTCIVCQCELLPPESPPHCIDCQVSDEQFTDWESSQETVA